MDELRAERKCHTLTIEDHERRKNVRSEILMSDPCDYLILDTWCVVLECWGDLLKSWSVYSLSKSIERVFGLVSKDWNQTMKSLLRTKKMEDYISVNEGLLGRETSNQIPRYEFIDGKLKRTK